MVLEALDEESCVTKYNRTRMVFESTKQCHKSDMTEDAERDVERAYCLNEVFCAEKDVG